MFSNKVSGFLAITVLVAVSLFAYSFFAGSDSVIAGQASGLLCKFESDGGFEPEMYGYVYTTSGDQYDYCSSNEILVEGTCDNNNFNQQKYDCASNGLVCLNGACQPVTLEPYCLYLDFNGDLLPEGTVVYEQSAVDYFGTMTESGESLNYCDGTIARRFACGDEMSDYNGVLVDNGWIDGISGEDKSEWTYSESCVGQCVNGFCEPVASAASSSSSSGGGGEDSPAATSSSSSSGGGGEDSPAATSSSSSSSSGGGGEDSPAATSSSSSSSSGGGGGSSK